MREQKPGSVTWQGFVGFDPDEDHNLARRGTMIASSFVMSNFA